MSCQKSRFKNVRIRVATARRQRAASIVEHTAKDRLTGRPSPVAAVMRSAPRRNDEYREISIEAPEIKQWRTGPEPGKLLGKLRNRGVLELVLEGLRVSARDERSRRAGGSEPSGDETKAIDCHPRTSVLPGRTQFKTYDNFVKSLNRRMRRHCEAQDFRNGRTIVRGSPVQAGVHRRFPQ